MVTFLLDTNAFVEPMRPKPNSALMRKLMRHAEEVCISAVTLHEVTWGVARMAPGKRRRTYEEYFSAVTSATPIAAYDADAARVHAAQRARLEALGTPASYEDGQIAGVALARGLILVTNNVKHFARFLGLSVENWMA